ncbi:Signal transduction response regulator, receiver region domain protein [Candidatus Magnetomorum sp. HK-1]|nr:Signal transduction response regulator, receiver region domain protein [Candidatus Magnetomorum sp. HK-1]
MTQHKKYHIIHLEDNPDVSEIMSVLFENEDVLYEHVSSTEEAFDVLDKKIPHLVLVDLMLIDDDDAIPGVEFIKQAYNKYTGIKMMVLSNRGDQSLKEELAPYIIGYEVKIFRPSIYKKQLLELLQKMEEKNE